VKGEGPLVQVEPEEFEEAGASEQWTGIEED
jgi:hypothetical protein